MGKVEFCPVLVSWQITKGIENFLMGYGVDEFIIPEKGHKKQN
jgi:hypothetical protein